jgi:metal-dependent amidase/aminoacylase/carboxypeptidase family protein
MIRMEIESENETPSAPTSYFSHERTPTTAPPSHNLSLDEMRTLKKKQEKNILDKIEKIVQKVTPIHEADYESDNEHDMHDLIEEFEKMDVE